jgi:hypothetical protein
LFVNFIGCRDATDTPLVGFSFNGSMFTANGETRAQKMVLLK